MKLKYYLGLAFLPIYILMGYLVQPFVLLGEYLYEEEYDIGIPISE